MCTCDDDINDDNDDKVSIRKCGMVVFLIASKHEYGATYSHNHFI